MTVWSAHFFHFPFSPSVYFKMRFQGNGLICMDFIIFVLACIRTRTLAVLYSKSLISALIFLFDKQIVRKFLLCFDIAVARIVGISQLFGHKSLFTQLCIMSEAVNCNCIMFVSSHLCSVLIFLGLFVGILYQF